MLTLQGNLTFGQGTESANVIGGFGGNSQFPGNSVASGVVGATIAGGGGASNGASLPNTVSGNWGTVGGGSGNLAYNWFSTVAAADPTPPPAPPGRWAEAAATSRMRTMRR